MEPPAVITEHLAGMAADWRALTDCELAVRVGVGDAAATQGAVSSDAELVRPLDSSSVNLIFPVHSAILTRWSVTARSVLAAMGEGVAQAAGSPEAAAGQALGAALEGYSRASIVLFLRALYTLPSRQALAEVLCSAKREEETEEVIFEFALEPVLRIAKAFDCPDLFAVAEEALLEDPALKLAVLMSPHKWLPLLDEYSHMGYLGRARSAAVSHLSAKFSVLQGDPGIAALSHGALVDLVRMLGYRLASLARTCSHVQAVQERSMQRFAAIAQEVAALHCPDPTRAASYLTNWAVSTHNQAIKLSWALDPAADAAQQAAQAQQEVQVQAQLQPPVVQLPVYLQAIMQPQAPQAASTQQQQQHAAAHAHAVPHLLAALVPGPPVAAQLVGSWHAVQAAQNALAAQQAAVNSALDAQMEVLHQEQAQQLELLAGQAALRAEEMAAALAAQAAAAGRAEGEDDQEEEEGGRAVAEQQATGQDEEEQAAASKVESEEGGGADSTAAASRSSHSCSVRPAALPPLQLHAKARRIAPGGSSRLRFSPY